MAEPPLGADVVRRNAATASPRVRRTNGIAIMWAWRSAKRKEKNGNSVISLPPESDAYIRELRQKSNSPNGCPSNSTRLVPDTTWNNPSMLPMTATKSAPVNPAITADAAPVRTIPGRNWTRSTSPCTTVNAPPTVIAKNIGTARLYATDGMIPVKRIMVAVMNWPK